MPVTPSLNQTSSQFQNLKIPNYVNPATLNPATQPKLQSPLAAPSVAAPEMFPNLTKALGNFGNFLTGAGGFFGTPLAKNLGTAALSVGGAFGGPTYKPPAPAIPSVVAPQQSNPATYYNAAAGAVTPTPGAKTPIVPQVALHPNIQTPSGATVNPSTGAAVTPPGGDSGAGGGSAAPVSGPTTAPITAPGVGGNPPAIAGSTTDTATMPTIPNISGSGFGTIPTTPYDTPEYKSAEKAFEESQNLTPEEIANKQNQDALAASASAALTNTEKQPIPLEFITGQKSVIQKEAANQSDILKNQAATLEAVRTGKTTAAKAALDLANAKASYMKPMSVTAGNELYIPGQGFVSSPFGGGANSNGGAMGTTGDPSIDVTSPGYTSNVVGGTGLTQSAIDQAAINLGLTGQLPAGARSSTGIGGLQSTAIKNRLAEMDPSGNIQAHKAQLTSLQSTLTKQTDYVNTTERAYNTAVANFGVLINFMQGNNLNTSGVPMINQLQNMVKSGALDPGSVQAFKSSLQGLRAEYAQVLSRGGDVTDTSRNEANSLIPDNLTPEQLKKVQTQLNLEGTNAINEAKGQVKSVQDQINGIIKTGSSSSKSAPKGANPSDPYSQW